MPCVTVFAVESFAVRGGPRPLRQFGSREAAMLAADDLRRRSSVVRVIAAEGCPHLGTWSDPRIVADYDGMQIAEAWATEPTAVTV